MAHYEEYVVINLEEDPLLSPSSVICQALDAYQSVFDEHWGIHAEAVTGEAGYSDEDQWREYLGLHNTARMITEVASTLIRRKGFGPSRAKLPKFLEGEASSLQRTLDEFIELAEPLNPEWTLPELRSALMPFHPSDPRVKSKFIMNVLELEAQQLFHEDLELLAVRISRLVEYAVKTSNLRAANYLTRVARCYVLNMPAEFAVMSRAALEAAISMVVSDEEAQEQLGRRGLSAKIELCQLREVLDSRTAKDAKTIKVKGDEAIHVDARTIAESDMESLLEAMVRVLERLPATDE